MGNEIGAHGGWAHNYFAFNINEHNGAEWTPYLGITSRIWKTSSISR
jgi:hypothetical protein